MAPFILLLAFFLALILLVIIFITYSIIWIPYKIQRQFYRQGIKGPGYHPIYGNTPEFKQEFDRTYTKPVGSFSHDIVHRLDPPYHKWTALYGKTVLFWQGIVPWIILSEPEMLKEVYLNKSGHIVRGKISPPVDLLFGQGLFNLGGDKWSLHRKVANPAFMIDQVKSWIPEVVDSVEMVVKKWEDEIEERNETEVEVMQEFRLLSSEILSRTAFGSSYGEGKHIFELEDQQAKLVLKGLRTAYIPGFRFLPTHDNRIRWKIERKIRSLITKLIINKDQEEVGNSKSLLNFLLNGGLPFEEVIDECQAFYFAGKEAVTILMTWTIVLLSMHQDWQTKAREEVFRVWKTNKEFPNADTLNDLKVVSLIINEVLRLYPPVPTTFREASKDMKVKNVNVPAGTKFYLPIAAVHHDTELWGEDATEFNPQRFLDPRKHLVSFSPFGLGSRTCIGQNFAVMEGKIILATLLKHFTFRLSPSYVHAPVMFLTVAPQFGAQILVSKISS